MKQFTRLATAVLLGLSLTLASCRRVEPPVVNTSSPDGSMSSDPANTTDASMTTSNSETTTPVEITGTTDDVPTTSREETTTSGVNGGTSRPSSAETSGQTAEISTSSTTRDAFGNLIDDFLNPTVPNAQPGSIRNPLAPGETAHFDGYDTLFDPFRADVSVQQIYRGTEALQMVKDASTVNPDPDPGYEYLVAQVLVKITASKNGEAVGVSPYFFSLAREDGRMYGDVSLFRAITPVLSTIHVGETSIGYICFQVEKADQNPFIVFLSRAHGGIWFSTSENSSEPTSSTTTRFSVK